MCYKIVNEFSFNLATLGGLSNIINQEYVSLSVCSYGRTNTNISLSTPPRLFMDNLWQCVSDRGDFARLLVGANGSLLFYNHELWVPLL